MQSGICDPVNLFTCGHYLPPHSTGRHLRARAQLGGDDPDVVRHLPEGFRAVEVSATGEEPEGFAVEFCGHGLLAVVGGFTVFALIVFSDEIITKARRGGVYP